MIPDFNAKPASYKGPQGRFERFLCETLFRLMLDTPQIKIDLHGPSQLLTDAEFVLAPPRLWTIMKILVMPDMCVGESYVVGNWYLVKGSLTDFLDAVERNANAAFRSYYDFISRMGGWRYYLSQYILNKTYTRKVKEHYEIDSKIYELILDHEMLYTCAFFTNQEQDLATAQQNKLRITIERMALPEGPIRVLDMGCGWGGFARAIVKANRGAEVCGLTISASQIEWARKRDAEELSSHEAARIEYRQEDYVSHDRTECYDSISVIGMIEHVGLGGYDEFFAKIYGLLKSGGTAVIHTIISPLPAVPSNSWIDKRIFRGGYIPSISELIRVAERHSFHISGVHIHRPWNYRRTIECWLENFINNIDRVGGYLATTGYRAADTDRFIRTWIFYLSSVRNMFSGDRELSHQTLQLCIKKLQI
jgi:cyclopropane-fatty-acyl-phospholipid synthase